MTELRGDVVQQGATLRGEMAELRAELRTEIADLRTDLGTEMADLHTDSTLLRNDLTAAMRIGFAEVRSEMHKSYMSALRWCMAIMLSLGAVYASVLVVIR